jgi:hypothetical protein
MVIRPDKIFTAVIITTTTTTTFYSVGCVTHKDPDGIFKN